MKINKARPIKSRMSATAPKVYGLDDKVRFGKYDGHTISYIVRHDIPYIEWLRDVKGLSFKYEVSRLLLSTTNLLRYGDTETPATPSMTIGFGKYLGQSVQEVLVTDFSYIRWLHHEAGYALDETLSTIIREGTYGIINGKLMTLVDYTNYKISISERSDSIK